MLAGWRNGLVRLAIAEKLAAVIADPRDALPLVHRLPQILRARILAIACGSSRALEQTTDASRQRAPAASAGCCSYWLPLRSLISVHSSAGSNG
jgi:hypothetical protein